MKPLGDLSTDELMGVLNAELKKLEELPVSTESAAEGFKTAIDGLLSLQSKKMGEVDDLIEEVKGIDRRIKRLQDIQEILSRTVFLIVSDRPSKGDRLQ